MLISEPRIYHRDPLTSLLAAACGHSDQPHELRAGIYELGHFGDTHLLSDYEHYPEFPGDNYRGSYGVCDDVDNLIAHYPELEAPGREFVVTMTKICRDDEPDCGGWRWHKWGKYIGAQDPQREYIHDEPSIEEVWCFHIYERRAA